MPRHLAVIVATHYHRMLESFGSVCRLDGVRRSPVMRRHCGQSPVTDGVPDESISRTPRTEPSGILIDPN